MRVQLPTPELIHCEYINNRYQVNLFDIGYFITNTNSSSSSSSTSILVNKAKKAILTKLNLLNNDNKNNKSKQYIDVKLINKNNGWLQLN